MRLIGFARSALECGESSHRFRHVIGREFRGRIAFPPATEAVALQFRGVQTISDLLQEAIHLLGIL
jgi:hypothetical protein